MKAAYRSIILALCFILVSSNISVGAQDKGLIRIENYTSKTYAGHPQNWCITQAKNGVMYFGNNHGVLRFDGVGWQLTKVTNQSNVRSLAFDSKDRLYVGASDELGYLMQDSIGRSTYISLLGQVDENHKDLGDVWNIIALKDRVVFGANNEILILQNDHFKYVQTDTKFTNIYQYEDKVIVHEEGKGLLYLEADSLIPIPGLGQIKDDQVLDMTTDINGNLILLSFNNGIIKCDKKFNLLPWEGDSFTKANRIKMLKNGNLVIGTWENGVIELDPAGKEIYVIDENSQLQDPTINDLFEDHQGNLWATLSNGISKIDINSSISFINDKLGFKGTIEAITRHNGILYLATNTGLLKLIEGKPYPTLVNAAETNSECWDVLSWNNGTQEALLSAFNGGIYSLTASGKTVQISDCIPWCMKQSISDPNRVFIGTDPGFTSIYYSNGKWEQESLFEKVTHVVRNIEEDKSGIIWLGTASEGIIQASINYDTKQCLLTYIDSLKGLPSEYAFAVMSDKWQIIGGYDGLYRYDEKSGTVKINVVLFNAMNNEPSEIFRAEEDHNGQLWIARYPHKGEQNIVGVATNANGILSWNESPFTDLNEIVVYAIHHDKDGITWLGGPDGLVRFEQKQRIEQTETPLFRQIYLNKDSIIQYGPFVSDDSKESAIFTIENNSIHFAYASPDFIVGDQVLYTHLLEGFDRSWSEWDDETKTGYTNLNEGRYELKIKAKNKYGLESNLLTYRFTITPPWHHTKWAYGLFVLLGGLFVYFVVKLNARRLNEANRKLEQIIEKRTAQIVHQKEELEEKNKDITDSIRYAKRIQQAILTSEDYIKNAIDDHFILYKPKDIVSGDFYWMYEDTDKVIICAADCTGHGVPGAFMSMIGNSLLNEIVIENHAREPDDILNKLREGIIKALHQRDTDSKDGMDIAMVCFNKKTFGLEFSGANNPLYLFRKDEALEETKGDKQPIGQYEGDLKPFTKNQYQLNSGDQFYIFSDGFADQFGGPKGKKFKTKQFKHLLHEIRNKGLKEQQQILDRCIEKWRGELEQIDDICVIGVRV